VPLVAPQCGTLRNNKDQLSKEKENKHKNKHKKEFAKAPLSFARTPVRHSSAYGVCVQAISIE
jgi:hypothetical protein